MTLLPRYILHSLVRKKARLHKTPLNRYRVFIARNVEDYEDAFKLLHVAYAYQGIESVREGAMYITPQHVLPESTVFVAYDEHSIVGTVTATLDSPAGLPLDHDYPKHCQTFRDNGDLLVEYGSLAVIRRCWHSGVANLLSMAVIWWARSILKATTAVIGVHPKAVPYYEALYNFKVFGETRDHDKLTAPVQGMTHNLAETGSFSLHHFTKPMSNGVSFGKALVTLDIPCIDIPRHLSSDEQIRWKLPRQVFQEIFIDKSDRLDRLNPLTRRYLEQLRTKYTLKFPIYSSEREAPVQNA